MSTDVLQLGGSLAEPSEPGSLAERGAHVGRWDIAKRPLRPTDPAQRATPLVRLEKAEGR